jgi:hypothetical protein
MKDFIKTSDTAFAAYLMLKEYTHLGCVDNGEASESGHPRLDHYLTHSNEVVRDTIAEHASELRDEFMGQTDGYRQYYLMLHKAKKQLRRPLNIKEMGGN